MTSETERAFLFSTDKNSGNRMTVETITRKSIIGFMDATPWCGDSRDTRRKNALERIHQFVETVYEADAIKNLHICSYASPKQIDVENKWVRIGANADLANDQQKFMEKYFIPLISTPVGGGGGGLTVLA